ncbi:unnamed protein product [Toxocara canis]|uniref:Cystatin domain-containing protein n=1 Tax=Toxocara canis TaxID=6265 RepID=A0A183VBB6_TOXCA|nr:unnamed protein product [Toxocara canis]
MAKLHTANSSNSGQSCGQQAYQQPHQGPFVEEILPACEQLVGMLKSCALPEPELKASTSETVAGNLIVFVVIFSSRFRREFGIVKQRDTVYYVSVNERVCECIS